MQVLIPCQAAATAFGLTVLMAAETLQRAVRLADPGHVMLHRRIAYAGGSAAERKNSQLIRAFHLGV